MPLTTVEKVKRYLQISLSDTTDDDFINDLILEVNADVEMYCHRHFDINTYTAEQHIIMHKIFTNEYPIKSVQSIMRIGFDTFDLASDTGLLTNYRLFPSYIELMDPQYVTMSNKFQYANHEESYVEITYTAGYGPNEIPPDLSLATTKLVALEYKESRESRLGIEQEFEGDLKFIYAKKDSQMPLNISAVLDKYKKVSV